MELTVQNVYGLLLRSRLMEIDAARSMFDRWNKEAGDQAANLVRFARWMVENKYLTEYQATLLARGYADGFFLNQYRILDRLGKGRMAGVYRAQHESGAVVAIKVLPPSKARDRALLSRFHREAKLAVRLKHPNVVRTFEVGKAIQPETKEKLYYLVMEHLEGETLEDLLQRKKKFSPPEGSRLIHQALLGLQHIHEQGLVHRDLKPSNMMLAYHPNKGGPPTITLKLLDLGLGRALADAPVAHQSTTENSALTREGVLLGTPDYMSPEQARDARSADIRSDIYSLGCVLYHLLTGQPPYPDSNVISQMIRHATETPRPIKDLSPEVPDGLQQIIDWMVAKDPAKRYPTPARAAQALEMYLAAGAPLPSSPEMDPGMQPYLKWLATKKDSPAKPKNAVKVKKDTGAAIPVVVGEKKKSGGGKKAPQRGNKQPRKKEEPVKPVAVPPAPINVELVPLPSTAPPPQRLFSLPLSTRDLVMFGVGVATVILGGGVGLLAAVLFGAFD